jgi:hypothetical protein
MIQVRDVFQVKFGSSDQAVALFARLPKVSAGHAAASTHYHVLTDISGPMYTLVTELMVDNLSQWEKMRDDSFASPDFDEWFKQFQLFVEDGRREYYTLEGECQDWSKPGVIVVREVYKALKWQIRPAVGLIQRYGALLVDRGVGQQPRILTDASGPMFQIVIEIETESLAAWESSRRDMFKQPEFQVWFTQLLTQVRAGSHEFYRVENTVTRS